jgi:hypothetical protein
MDNFEFNITIAILPIRGHFSFIAATVEVLRKANELTIDGRGRMGGLHDPPLYSRSGRVQVFFHSFRIKMLFKD